MDTGKTSIMLLEDDSAQYALLAAYLEKETFKVIHADCIKSFNALMKTEKADLVLLDLNLPDGDGLELIKKIEGQHHLPVIIITTRNTIDDRLLGMELGADDYICKPYHPRELIIRINRLMHYKNVDCCGSLTIQFADFCFNEKDHAFYDARGDEIKLTAGEYHIMTDLLKSEGRTISRDQLISSAFQRNEYPVDRSVDVLVSRLRKKFDRKEGEPEIIQTVKGFGYRINKAVIK